MKSLLNFLALTSLGLLASAISFPTKTLAATCTTASYYGHGDGYHNQITASGERFNAYGNSTAHRSLPFNTRLLVTHSATGKSIVVRVNDRGPYVAGRGLDLSYGAYTRLAPSSSGVTKVCYSVLN